MTIRKPGIPSVSVPDQALASILNAMKENIEIMTGARPKVGTIAQLASTASTADIIKKINEIIVRLNVTGS